MTTAIVSYDDTLNDHDALMLGRLLAGAGAILTLAYVRHTTQTEVAREELEEHDAEALLERGARWLGDVDVDRRVIVSASTGEGLKRLAAEDDVDIVVFGSDYRTAPGHVAPQHSTQALLEGGTAAVAIAPANYRAQRDAEIRRIGVLAGPGDEAALHTAHALADALRRRADHRPARCRSARRRLARGGPRGPRDGERPESERDRERHRAGARAGPRRGARVRLPAGDLLSRSRAAGSLREGPRGYGGERLRTLVVSDFHLGNRLRRDVLRHPEPLRRLLAALDGVDRLVLLGDVAELRSGRRPAVAERR